MKLKSFFIPRIRENYIKPLTVHVGTSKIKATLFSTFLLILVTLEVMDIQKLLHGNEIRQYFQN